ncbi:6-phosphogluconolactonase [Flavihumibacter petaseus]|nr:6-phosphogluconolactonase [Flavihumibacter petaseus]
MSITAADALLERLSPVASPTVAVASGDSPAGMYRNLVSTAQDSFDFSSWKFVGLDEWEGLNGSDEGSCRYHLDRQLFWPLQVKASSMIFFDGRAKDPEAECRRTEAFIREAGGLDVAVIGLGLNGHVGMNEPGGLPGFAHVTELAEQTRAVGQKYFSRATPLTRGLTLGLQTLLDSKTIFLLVSGEKKASVLAALMQQDPDISLPVTMLKRHADFRIFADAAAASAIR